MKNGEIMEVKLIKEFDFKDKNLLFGQMDSMNDAIVKEIRESGNSLYIVLHKFDGILAPGGKAIWPYKELEIEYEYAEEKSLNIYVGGGKPCFVKLCGLLDLLKKENAELEMNTWLIGASGYLTLYLLVNPLKMRRRFWMEDVEIQLLPKKITYRFMS